MDETTGKKLAVQGELNKVVGLLVMTFGAKEATKMLRAAAKMIAPVKEEK